jgi:hypothetical protein
LLDVEATVVVVAVIVIGRYDDAADHRDAGVALARHAMLPEEL